MIEFSRRELHDILGWVFDAEDKILHQLRRGGLVNTMRHECIEAVKKKVIVHTLHASKEQSNDEKLVAVEFSREELCFITENARYHADLAMRRKFDLGDGERAQKIYRKAFAAYSECAA